MISNIIETIIGSLFGALKPQTNDEKKARFVLLFLVAAFLIGLILFA
jgi:hypothetical protein